MSNAIFTVPSPRNESVLDYAPGSTERASLKAALSSMASSPVEIPVIIGGREIFTGQTVPVRAPHDHAQVLAICHQAGSAEVEQAIESCMAAWHDWSSMPWESRAAIFLKAAELLAGPWRNTLNAATMLGQSKTVFQAEIDAACELVDFWRFNARFMAEIYAQQPASPAGVWNRSEYRALEGFVFAVTPFNFTSIAGNLPTAPAMLGNVALWKPALTAVLSNYYIFKLLQAAGLPDGAINFIPAPGPSTGKLVLPQARLAGVHFTGSTSTFQTMWRAIGESIANYRVYPRTVGETGGKDFIFAHPSADVASLVVAMVRGAFEYQGQKCSAASRAYVPASLWPQVRESVEAAIADLRMGSPLDFRNFMAAVIDRPAFDRIAGALERARGDDGYELIAGGGCDDTQGFFIEPTVVWARDPGAFLMCEEIFGPVLTVFVYDDADLAETARLCDRTSPYGLTGSIFAADRGAIVELSDLLRHSAGNFYINDKPTGAVVSQQPFGGGRASGTNDKAGSVLNLLRWVSQRVLKETFVPPSAIGYPHMGDE